MNKNIFEIYKECSEEALLTELKGDNISISNIAPIEKSGPGDLVFVDKKERKYVDKLNDILPLHTILQFPFPSSTIKKILSE